MATSSRYAVILAAGAGRRMQRSLPKQFLELDGKPVLRLTIERFLAFDPQMRLIVVLPVDGRNYWESYCAGAGFHPALTLCNGGETRFHSVQKALELVPDGVTVAVHDGVRPFVTPEFLAELFEQARHAEALVPVLPLRESLRETLPDGSSRAVERERFVSVQTPQLFRSELLKQAYAQPFSPAWTDDASVAEASGIKISLCEGRRENLKITTPEDLAVAEVLTIRQAENP